MDVSRDAEQRISDIEAELVDLEARRTRLFAELGDLRRQTLASKIPDQPTLPLPISSITLHSPQEEKIRLFRTLFRGREDVFPRRFESAKTGKTGYQPVCRNEWAPGICRKPKVPCADCGSREFVPVSDEVIRNHLMGMDPQSRSNRDFTMGVYPMLPDETCWFLAVDFDKSTWTEDAQTFLDTCQSFNLSAGLERSRSGNGGHVWIFFVENTNRLGSLTWPWSKAW